MRRMKKIYQKRRKALVDALTEQFSAITILGHAAGMHLVVEFQRIDFTEKLVEWIKSQKLIIYPVEDYALQKGSHTNQIVMGYGSLTEVEITEGVARLKRALETFGE